MATDLTNLFGPQISVHRQPKIVENQFTGFPGANGVTSMHLGSRGAPFVISGRLFASGTDYDDARANLDAWLKDIEAILMQPAASYSFRGSVYDNLQFIRFQLLTGAGGHVYHYTSGYVFVEFVMHGHILA